MSSLTITVMKEGIDVAVAGPSLDLEVETQQIVIGTPLTTAGESNTGANVGSGAGVFRDKIGATLNLRSITGSNGATVTQGVDEIDVSIAGHAARHQNGGADEVSVAGLSGLLADQQTPLAHHLTHEAGGSDVVLGAELVAAVTLAVSISGNDTDPARPARITSGDWSANPFATVQGALDALPKTSALKSVPTSIEVSINVSAGTYPGFLVSGFNINININGARSVFTPATGPQTGTFTSGSGGRILTLTGAGWTTNNLVGHMLSITSGPGSGQVIPIFSNTSDTIILAGRSAPAIGAGSVFSIEQPSVEINTPYPGGTTARVYIVMSRRARFFDLKTTGGLGFAADMSELVRFDHCVAYVTSGSSGFSGSYCELFGMRECAAIGVTGSTSGFTGQNNTFWQPLLCMAVNFTGDSGFAIYGGASWAFLANGCACRNCKYGVFVIGGGGGILIKELLIDGCQYGMFLEQAAVEIQDPEINNSTVKAFSMALTIAEINGVIKGTGNAGYGLDASGVGNTIHLASTPTLTGASGNATVDGTTELVWATDLAAAGDCAVNMATGSRISRP